MHFRTCSAALPDISVRCALYSIRYTIAGTEGSSSSRIIFIVTVELLQLDLLHDDFSARRTVARLEYHRVCNASPYRSPTTSWRKGVSKSDRIPILPLSNQCEAYPISRPAQDPAPARSHRESSHNAKMWFSVVCTQQRSSPVITRLPVCEVLHCIRPQHRFCLVVSMS